jgi:viroplasmin and RNaseH domain-containing protein
MKYFSSIILFFFAILFSGCCNQKKITEEKTTLNTVSFKDGNETILLLNNKSLDTIHQNGSLSYALKDNASTDVIRYTYEINMDQVQVDGGLREELLFEIPHGDFELNLTNRNLQNTKMLFGRYCYCRGQNGIFSITNGVLDIRRKDEKLTINLNFAQDKVPQKIKAISLK